MIPKQPPRKMHIDENGRLRVNHGERPCKPEPAETNRVANMNEEKPTYEQLQDELKALKLKHADVTDQFEELRKGKIVTQSELEDIKRIRGEHQLMHLEQNKIALWLRDNKAQEIARGEHAGKSLAEVCIQYMRHSLKKPSLFSRLATRDNRLQ